MNLINKFKQLSADQWAHLVIEAMLVVCISAAFFIIAMLAHVSVNGGL